MDLDALEVLQAVDRRPAQTTENADTGEEEVCNVFEFLELAILLCRALDGEVPLAGLLVVASGLEFMSELDVRPELVLFGGILEVLKDLGSGSVESRPIGLNEREVSVSSGRGEKDGPHSGRS